jgi:hypothetical protein
LRLEFRYRCVYCLACEAEVGPSQQYGGFEVEHFKPKGVRRFAQLRSQYHNLLWACYNCNRAKGETWPTQDEQKRGYRFADPTKEGLRQHLEVQLDVVHPLTATGEYVVEEVNLNSSAHRHRRALRIEYAKKIAKLEASLAAVRSRYAGGIAGLADELLALEEALRAAVAKLDREPWDPPSRCECG